MVGGGPNEEGRKRIDAAIGGLVWVQRRNGSWWPGQIVGLDEVSDTSLPPRSGTPIKLLGRDDSTVDWYDLEKPKGVKAFRCGEHDACIEKAKAAAAKPSKRSAKYPRRENAIILALEIERSSLFGDCPDSHSPASNPDSEPVLNSVKDSASMSQPSRDNDKTSSDGTSPHEENSHSTQELSHSGISYEETNGSTYLKGQAFKGRRKTPNDSEDDGNEGIKRMKGLDDLGIIAAERRVQVLALANPVKSSPSVHHARANGVSAGTVENGGCLPTSKRKRSQVVHIHELLKRKYRRRPLTKVLENTTMVPVRIICDEFATPFERSDAISPYSECGDGDKVKDVKLMSKDLFEHHSSDMLFDVPFVDEELHPSGTCPIGKPSACSKPHTGSSRARSGRNCAVNGSSFGHEMGSELPTTSSTTACMDLKMEKSASKWQSKGKRKARHINKAEELYSRKKADVNHEKLDGDVVVGHENSNGLVNGFTDWRKASLGCSQRGGFTYHHHHHHQARFLSQCSYEIPDGGIYGDSSLYEVEIRVEATRPQMQQVPYISLMSKLNGKPITGHPVTVEIVCDYNPASGNCDLDDDDDDEMVAPAVKPKAKVVVRRMKHMKRRSHFSRGVSRSKRHGPSSKKTRKLSSLTGPHKQLNPEKRKLMVQSSSSSKGPMLACVPLKVVFSRINEALNSSARSNHHFA